MELQFSIGVLFSSFLVAFSDHRQFRQACHLDGPYFHFNCTKFDYGCMNANWEDTCKDPSQKCCPVDCGYACTDAVYEKSSCPYVGEEGENFFLDHTTTYRLCLNDSNCPDGLLCCRGFCDFPRICHRPEYRRVECPDFAQTPPEENFENPPKAKRCSAHHECLDDHKLCCLNGRDTEKFCIEPFSVLPGEISCDYEKNECSDVPLDKGCLANGKLCYETGCGFECLTPPARK